MCEGRVATTSKESEGKEEMEVKGLKLEEQLMGVREEIIEIIMPLKDEVKYELRAYASVIDTKLFVGGGNCASSGGSGGIQSTNQLVLMFDKVMRVFSSPKYNATKKGDSGGVEQKCSVVELLSEQVGQVNAALWKILFESKQDMCGEEGGEGQGEEVPADCYVQPLRELYNMNALVKGCVDARRLIMSLRAVTGAGNGNEEGTERELLLLGRLKQFRKQLKGLLYELDSCIIVGGPVDYLLAVVSVAEEAERVVFGWIERALSGEKKCEGQTARDLFYLQATCDGKDAEESLSSAPVYLIPDKLNMNVTGLFGYPTLGAHLVGEGMVDERGESEDGILRNTGDAAEKICEENVIERRAGISDEDFDRTFFRKQKSVVITDVASPWNAIKSWRDPSYSPKMVSESEAEPSNGWEEGIVSRFGNRTVPVELGLSGDGDWHEERMLIGDFFRTLMYPSCKWYAEHSSESLVDTKHTDSEPTLPKVGYLAQHPLFTQIPALLEELGVPSYCSYSGELSNINAWIGTAGTVTPLHFDSYDNFLVQVCGFKYVRLYEESQSHLLYPGRQAAQASNVSSANGSTADNVPLAQMNVSQVDVECEESYKRYPLAKKAKYTHVILGPGEMLFIPSHTWHMVRSLTPSISVNYWF
eukprot:Nk52_evm32s628 gene=Nk52_evmTU32s628